MIVRLPTEQLSSSGRDCLKLLIHTECMCATSVVSLPLPTSEIRRLSVGAVKIRHRLENCTMLEEKR